MSRANTSKKGPFAKTPIKLELIGGALILLILALGFNALLSLNSLEKLYVESIASQYSAIGKDLQRNLEKSLRFGKNIKKFVGMNKILEETQQNISRKINPDSPENEAQNVLTPGGAPAISVSVALPDDSILYSTDEQLVGTTLPEASGIDYGAPENSSQEPGYVKYGRMYITPLPIRDMKQTWIATAIIMFDEKQVKTLLNNIRNKDIKTISVVLACSIALLIILLNLVTPDMFRLDIFPKWKISLVMFLVIVSAQIVFSGLNVNAFKNYYLQINKEKTRMLTTLLKEDIEFFFSKGIQIDKLVKMDVVLGEIIAASPELSDITILDKENTPLYMATKEGVVDFQKATDEQLKLARERIPSLDPRYNLRLDLLKNDEVEGYISAHTGKEGYISTNLSKKVIFAKLIEIALDSATILVISMLFFGELLILIFQFIEKQAIDAKSLRIIHYEVIRPATFLFFFGIDTSITFLPLHMENLYEPILGLSKEVVLGLPISIEMFFAGLATIIAGAWIDRRGWHESFFSGLFLTSAGYVYSWMAPDALHFIISRGVVGIGYGLSFMAAQGFVISYTDERSKAQGLTQLFAGLFAGSICGGAAGAMLAERIGYQPVFLVGAVIVVLVMLYTISFMRGAIERPSHHMEVKTGQSVKTGQIFRFLFNRNVLSLILFSNFPAAIALIGFIHYFCPVYLNRIGASQSNIGRVYMIYGVCLIYLAPFISKYVDASNNKKSYIILAGLLGGLAFTSFYFLGGIVAVAFAVMMLGLAASFGSGSQNAYMLKLNVTQELGQGKAIGIYRSANRIGQVIGPMIFGGLIITRDLKEGVTYFGAAYLLATIFFFIIAQKESEGSSNENSTS